MYSWSITDITYYRSYIIAKENFAFFLFQDFLRHIHYPPHDSFWYFRKLVLLGCTWKRICYCSFLSAILEKQKSNISESLKFTSSLTKQFNLRDLLCCDKYHPKLYVNKQVHGTFLVHWYIIFASLIYRNNIKTPGIFSRTQINEIWWQVKIKLSYSFFQT